MESSSFFFLLQLLLLLISHVPLSTLSTCQNKCGSLEIKYPLGTGYGCGSPRFYPYVTCAPRPSGGDELLLNTHTGLHPITSISYTTSTLTITPPEMSTCSSMQPSPNFGLDWPSPFQLSGSSVFILLSCQPPTSSLTVKGIPICEPTYSYLCASIYTCPSVRSLGLPLFAPINTCCVYSPANLNTKDDLDLQSLKCAGYASVMSLGDVPTDPNTWKYGIELAYNQVGLDKNSVANSCYACERSDGICGYAPPRNNFVCVCKSGVNTSTDCYYPEYWSPISSSPAPAARLFSLCYVYVVCSVYVALLGLV